MAASLDIVFDHENFVVINKPTGMAVHSHEEVTLLDRVRDYYSSGAIHPVHRLDLATSGLMVFAKNERANQFFCQAFAEQKIAKLYIALTTHKPKKKQGAIVGDMAKARNGSYKLLRTKANPAKTYALSFGAKGEPRLWLLRPKSGKTHQLRVALKSWGAPILGDARYGGESSDRLYLHALALDFTFDNKHYSLSCLPSTGEYFKPLVNRLDNIGDPWQQAWPKAWA